MIREELEARGWTQGQLAHFLGRPLQTGNQIINGRKRVTPETAVEPGAASGTSPRVWLNLESAYRLAHARRPDPRIARRAEKLLARNG